MTNENLFGRLLLTFYKESRDGRAVLRWPFTMVDQIREPVGYGLWGFESLSRRHWFFRRGVPIVYHGIKVVYCAIDDCRRR